MLPKAAGYTYLQIAAATSAQLLTNSFHFYPFTLTSQNSFPYHTYYSFQLLKLKKIKINKTLKILDFHISDPEILAGKSLTKLPARRDNVPGGGGASVTACYPERQ